MAGLACAIWRDRAGAGMKADRGTAQAPRAGTGSRREHSSLSPLWEASLRGGDSPHPSCHLEQNWGEPTTAGGPHGSVRGSYSIHADLWMSGESKGWLTASELHSQKAAGGLSPEALCGSNRHQAGWKHATHRADTYTFANTHTQANTAGTVTVGTRNLGTSWGKCVNEEGWHVRDGVYECVHEYPCVWMWAQVCQSVSLEASSMTHRSYFGQSSLGAET